MSKIELSKHVPDHVAPRSSKLKAPAAESPAVQRSRRKLVEQFAREARELTPERLSAVKGVIADQIARNNSERMPVPGKGLSLFSPTKQLDLSAKVQAVMDRVRAELPVTASLPKKSS
jgi:hypothetical protein